MGVSIGSKYGVSYGTWGAYRAAVRRLTPDTPPALLRRHHDWPPMRAAGLGEEIDEDALRAVHALVAIQPLWLITEALISRNGVVLPPEFHAALRDRLARLVWDEWQPHSESERFQVITAALLAAIDDADGQLLEIA